VASSKGAGANSDPEEFEHCSKGQELKTCISEHFMWKSRFQAFKFVRICRKASLFSFWASGLAVFRIVFEKTKTRTQLSHKRYLT
jgi:hypothetical protein